jgi:hypothetical protein
MAAKSAGNLSLLHCLLTLDLPLRKLKQVHQNRLLSLVYSTLLLDGHNISCAERKAGGSSTHIFVINDTVFITYTSVAVNYATYMYYYVNHCVL